MSSRTDPARCSNCAALAASTSSHRASSAARKCRYDSATYSKKSRSPGSPVGEHANNGSCYVIAKALDPTAELGNHIRLSSHGHHRRTLVATAPALRSETVPTGRSERAGLASRGRLMSAKVSESAPARQSGTTDTKLARC